ncbi:hypothetical protein Phum_PHUM509680 [Pediculus humanus corporis]|uniref:Uncharacterized protein n=1 Tax=Pediculus humanus subsp. corporis TaxID=121224 RepID=E0VY68_PEDHC|nr:uncharacterized protein Phum_PHUM509680 [Pediculus humanus corporis]EEB18324.1 hypothetical protein Phum_PHUM509680 [Pediculus humanus corporis]
MFYYSLTVILLIIIGIVRTQTESTKWVWGNGKSIVVNGNRKYNEQLVASSLFKPSTTYNDDFQPNERKFRYDVTEEYPDVEYNTYRPNQQYRPEQPQNVYRPPYRPPPRPDYVKPSNS